MIFDGFEICCPFCRSELREINIEVWECESCHQRFPIIFGIPDLRVFPDPYVNFEDDRGKAARLASRFAEFNFEAMVAYYYSTTAVVPAHHAKQYTQGILAAVKRSEALLKENEVSEPLLEIGCGTGALLVAATKSVKRLIGIDIALRWLIVAKKRLSEAGCSVPLICACAEALPFTDSIFSTAVFDSTVEVVSDQKKALSETYRVLKPAGRLLINTPNRFSVGPDPHLNLWAGGYLPQSWIAAYALSQKAIPPKRKLLSIRMLKNLIKGSGFELIATALPEASEGQGKRFPLLARLYNISKKNVVGRFMLQAVGPLLQATARKPS
jgi:SAM-dependent methyltransferase